MVPHKIHVRGLDTFNPDEVKAYVAEKFSSSRFERVEWIDDSSANLIFDSASTAQEALVAFASIEIADPTQLHPLECLPAKPFSGKPDSALLVRLAVTGDKKVTGAAARSRFYLLHPEYDPEERKRRGEFNRGKYRDRDGYGRDRDRYRDRNRDDREWDRRRSGGSGRRRYYRYEDEESEPFDASLYDDDAAALAKRPETTFSPRRRGSRSDSDEDRYARRNRDKELFPDRRPKEKNNGVLRRGRSASPPRESSRMDMDNADRGRDAAVQNRDKARSIKDRLSQSNNTKELFPNKVSAPSSGPSPKAQMDQVDDSAVLTSGMSRVSLYSNNPCHKCCGFDGSNDATPRRSIHDSNDNNGHNNINAAARCYHRHHRQQGKRIIINISAAKLADRITPRSADAGNGNGALNIRGLANKRGEDQGIAIKGTGANARELFPEKFGNAGKELFADKLDRRSRRRQKAEDLFS